MKRIAMITLAATVAISQLGFGEDLPLTRRQVGSNRDLPAPAAGGQRPHANPTVRQLRPRVPHLQQNPQGSGAGINRSPRLQPRNFDRPSPAVTPAPVVPEQTGAAQQNNAANRRTGGRNWRDRIGDNSNTNNDGRSRNGGNNQPQNREDWRKRHHNGEGDHHWHHDWDRNHHDRNWWRSRYNRFVLFGGGYYYWDAGFWYPAYGYDPYFSSYVYDAPIYGYDSLQPGELMSTVQTELARLGYYDGEIDGTYGPQTRDALLRYQQAANLEVTGLLDQPTLESLGLY